MFHYWHTIGDRVFVLKGTVDMGHPGGWMEPPEPPEVDVTSITENGADAVDAFNALMAFDETVDGWYAVNDAILAMVENERYDDRIMGDRDDDE